MESLGNLGQDQEALGLWNKAVGYVRTGNIDAAGEIFLSLAQANYEGAAFAIGGILADSTARKTNLEEAIAWFQKAVNDENDVRAMVALARIYLTKGGERNNALALHFLEQAAKSGDVIAISVLGELYENGYIGQPNIEMAKSYYMRAANFGAIIAMIRLGNISWLERNFIKWFYWRAK